MTETLNQKRRRVHVVVVREGKMHNAWVGEHQPLIARRSATGGAQSVKTASRGVSQPWTENSLLGRRYPLPVRARHPAVFPFCE